MKHKNKSKQVTPFPASQAETESSAPGFFRLKIPLREDGTFNLEDWDIQDRRKEAARQLMSNPQFLQKIGGRPTASPVAASVDAAVTTGAGEGSAEEPSLQLPEELTADDVAFLFDIYAAALTLLMCNVMKAKWDDVWPYVKWDDEQKKLMSKPLLKVIKRHVPPEWLLNVPEIQLGIMVVGATTVKLNDAKAAIAAREEKAKQPPRKEPVPIAPTGQTSHNVVSGK